CTNLTGCPPAEYCPHCCNINIGVCGVCGANRQGTGGGGYETANWLDGNGNPMPWRSQGYYVEGGDITIDSYLDTHHNGHMEARVCVVNTDPNSCTKPENFAGNELVFESDLPLEARPVMPKDQNYPERGMYAGGQRGSIKSFRFMFKLPMGIYGEKVLLQWKYTTANSCSPPGYAAYFAKNSDLPSDYWSQSLPTCTLPYPNDGTRDTTWPEQFWNCGEITILAGNTTAPHTTSTPTSSPTTSSPTARLTTRIPTRKPTKRPPRG
ncbi:hypothetical protein ACHAW5_007069, partial [Stephanodiscus triporus]